MDLQSNFQPETGKLEQIVSQFLLKSLHIILGSRIACLSRHDRSGPRLRKSDKWFNLILGDRPSALENLHLWHRNWMDPMIVDIILVHESTGCSSVETVIERWVVQYEQIRGLVPHAGDTSASYKKIYKKSIILLRSLYSQMRFLPAYRILRQLRTSSHTCNFDIIYKVSSFSDPFSRAEEDAMEEYSFTSVEALPGHLSVSVTYRSTLSDFNLECTPSMPPQIIMDYVGSPNTDPMRSLSSSYKSVQDTSFLLRMPRPPSSAPAQRPHSWSSGFHQGAITAQNQHVVGPGSPPTYPAFSVPYGSPSSPDNFSHRFQNHRVLTPHRTISYEEYQLSPPFSPSQSSSSPTYSPNISRAPTKSRSESAPVTIPNPLTSRNSRNLFSPNFSDPSRHSLPPLSPMSPRSTKNEASSQESPSGIRSYRRIEVSRTGDIQPGLNTYALQKSVKDNKDDSGRFSGLLSSSGSPRRFSRSSSRLSFQDDLDDGGFSCPFDFDNVDTADFQGSQNADSKATSDYSSQSLPTGKKSHDAAVGVLVHMLRTAPPLRQDSSCYSSQSLKATKVESGVATASGFFIPRKTADALEELRSYKDMRDLLLSKSGTRIISEEPR